jgi:mannitol-1-/sugar-/sorbitol-6-phosphatase
MSEITCKAILFDMDGVLIDSTPAVSRVWTGWAREHGLEPDEVIKRAHGRPSLLTIREYLPDADHEAEDREVERREMTDLGGVKLLPGASELLRALPPGSWTIVTSATRPLAEVRLRTAGLPIPERIVTSNDIQNGKPDPEPYLKAASMLGVGASDCLVVEDVPAGILAGKRAGARVIAFRTTYDDSELTPAGPDWIVNDCSSLSVDPASTSKNIVLKIAI